MYNYSVVIPHYNSSSTLKRMLDSIPQRDDIQIIVVDDCSCQEEQDSLKSLTRDNMEIYYLEENRGAGAARNVGLEHIKGRWSIFVDSDDVFASDAFTIFDKYYDTDLDYISFLSAILDQKGHKLNVHSRANSSINAYLKKKWNYQNRFRYFNLVCWNKLVSMQFIKKYNIKFEECRVNNDVKFALQCGLFGKKYAVLNNKLYYAVWEDDSITRGTRSIEKDFQFYLQVLKRNGFYKKLRLTYMPFYRYEWLYYPYFLKKHGMLGVLNFIKLRKNRKEEIEQARKAYLDIFQ